jgi:hypothetical protein
MTGQNFLKRSKNISARATTTIAAQSSNAERSPPSQVTNGFALSGSSNLPDPATHAYRKDLADAGLAGRVIASHYAEPLVRHLIAAAALFATASADAEQIADLQEGDELRVLDISRGWAWGYGPNGRVGYVTAEAIAP